MKALITGANGHIGANLVRAAQAAGVTPIAFVRAGSDRRGLCGLDVEVREGDLLDAPSLVRAMQGVQVLFHVGAVHRNFDVDPARIERPAVEGTLNAVAAARKQGVERIVYTSTAATVGFAKDPTHPFDETHFLDNPQSAYIRGKVTAEEVVRKEAARGDGPAIVIVNPSGVFGPLDYRITPAMRAMLGLAQGDPAFLHLCLTDVRDVAQAHLLAAQKGRPGQRYLITGDNVAPAQLATLFTELAGVTPALFRPPTFLLRMMGAFFVRRARRDGSDTPFDPSALADVDGGQLAYDSSRSRSELGMTYRPAREVLTDTLRWLVHVGALKPSVATKVRAKLGERAAPDPGWA